MGYQVHIVVQVTSVHIVQYTNDATKEILALEEVMLLRWGTLIFSYIRRLNQYLWVHFFFEFQTFGVFRKNDHFSGMKILQICFGGQRKTGLFWGGGVISMHFWVFPYGQGTG